MRWRRLTWGVLATLAGVAGLAVLLAAFAAWLQLRPTAGDWTTEVPIAPVSWAPRLSVSVPRVIEAATDPRIGPWLDGRTLSSAVGAVRLQWHEGVLHLRCAPCTLRLAALGSEPLVLASGELSVRAEGRRRYSGRLSSGAVQLPWRGTLTNTGLHLQGAFGPVPMAEVYRLFASQVPELTRARIEGEIAGTWQASLPAGRWTLDPVLQGFAVSGLGTGALAHAALPARCAPGSRRAPAKLLEAAVIAAEDQRFFEHPGYDLVELLASFEGNQVAAAALRGGSTLTQQLAKQLYTGDARSAARKLRELLYAVEMETTLGKPRILALYLALAPWGDGLCGAHQAARALLGRPADKLDAVEAAWLASLLRQPSAAQAPVDRQRLESIVKAMPAASARERRERVERARSWEPPSGR